MIDPKPVATLDGAMGILAHSALIRLWINDQDGLGCCHICHVFTEVPG